MTEAQLRDLPVYESSPAFSALERLVLAYATEMTKTPVEVPEALFARLREHFDEPQLVELTAAIAWENYRARFDHALDIGAQGFSEAAWCALPERRPAGG
jgi:alkylhydroperoxidase family enzyme